jgi:transposase-like protein
MAKKGRPTKYNEKRADAIVRRIMSGNNREVAARAEGIDDATLYRWMAEKQDFRDRVHEADALAEADAVESWYHQGRRDWKALREWLACKYPDRWSQKTIADLNIGGQKDNPVVVIGWQDADTDAPTD